MMKVIYILFRLLGINNHICLFTYSINYLNIVDVLSPQNLKGITSYITGAGTENFLAHIPPETTFALATQRK